MAFFTLDDFSGSCECLMFGSTFEKCGSVIKEEATVLVLGKPESSGDSIKLQIENVYPLEKVNQELTKSIRITLDSEKHDQQIIFEMKKIFEKHSGTVPVVIQVNSNGSTQRAFFVKGYRIKASEQFIKSIISLVGEDNVLLCP